MWAVSERFSTTVARPHALATTVTAIAPGGASTPLTLAAGTVNVDRTQRIRRTASLTVRGGSALYEQLSTPGCRIAVDHGFAWSGLDRELVPLIRGELSSAALQFGDGFIQLSVADLWQGVATADYLTAYTPDPAASRADTALAAIQEIYPGIGTAVGTRDAGTVATSQAWTSRADMVNALATDAGLDAYFGPDGGFVLRPQPQITDRVAWVIKTGAGGTLESLTRSRPLDRVFNTVVLEPASGDAAQTWDQVVVQIDDLANPRHPTNLRRVVPYRYSAPTLLTEDEAIAVAQQLLVKVQGSTETLSLGALSNPALEAGDIVRVVTPIDGGNTIVNHFLDSISIDLVTGSMTCGTRASQELTT